MISLLFIRHGATAGNLEKRYIGRTDEPLCNIGISQALKIKELNFQADYLFVSPMLRTCQTAEIVFPKMPYSVVDDFMETDFGIFEGMTASELSQNRDYQAWIDSMCLAPVPCGESVSDFKLRCCRAFEEVMKSVPDNSCAVFVVHGGVIMAILESYAKPELSFYDYHIENGEYILCEFTDSCIRLIQE